MCYQPYFTKDGLPYACGKCPACAERHANGWAFRLEFETRRCDSVMWLRLSYDDAHLPIASNGLPTLRLVDVQNFFKRLRNGYLRVPRALGCVVRGRRWPAHLQQIKYFLCAEYGGQFKRPHYHVVVFNSDLSRVVRAWEDSDGNPIGEVYFDPRPFGGGAVKYTCGYMLKPCHAGYGRDTRERKFLLMSKRLGDNYLTDAQVRWHWGSPDRNFLNMVNGVKCALPRYYADKIFKPKSVNGFVCPVARIAFDLFKQERDVFLDAGVRAAAKAEYDQHVRVYGSADDFIRSAGEARRAGILNYQKLAKSRKDA